jgi:uncharacterized protein (TIGR04255 family)
MSTPSEKLPSYERPPVNEVAVAVTYELPQRLTASDLSYFWRTILRDELPDLEEQPPYGMEREDLGPPAPTRINLELMSTPPAPRLWAKSADGTKLVQLQPGWFAFNWRDRPESPGPYPRWPAIEAEFLRHYRQLMAFLAAEGIVSTAPEIVQCEVTYINNIASGGAWKDHGDLDKVLVVLSTPREFLPRPETAQLAMAFRMEDRDGVETGRLHITAQPAFLRADNAPVLVLTLTARGAPPSRDENGALEFLRLGHEWVVRGFTAITTDEMHKEWRMLPDA